MSPELPAELRCLLAFVRRGLGPAPDAPLPVADIRWPEFLRLVERHRLAPFLQRRAAALVAHLSLKPEYEYLHGAVSKTG